MLCSIISVTTFQSDPFQDIPTNKTVKDGLDTKEKWNNYSHGQNMTLQLFYDRHNRRFFVTFIDLPDKLKLIYVLSSNIMSEVL